MYCDPWPSNQINIGLVLGGSNDVNRTELIAYFVSNFNHTP